MCRLIETICVKDGELLHLSDHQERMDRSVFHLFGSRQAPDLEKHLKVPPEYRMGWIKCRVVYQHTIEEISWQTYHLRPIASIALVHDNLLDYSLKYENRSVFEKYIRTAQTDDVIIVRDGYLTDTSYANIILKSGSEWVTPSTPLLQGTQRKRLIESHVISEEPVRVTDLRKFEGLKYINAMLDIASSPEMTLDTIRHL